MSGLLWYPEISIGDLLTLVGFVFAVVSLIFAGVQLRRNTAIQRAQFLLDITDRYFRDSDVRRFFYKLDYRQFKLDFKHFIGSDEERWLDSLLYTFDIIGRMVKMKVVTREEVDVIAFQASRVLRNPEVQKYLQWLDGEYQREGRTERAHDDARFLAKTLFGQKAA